MFILKIIGIVLLVLLALFLLVTGLVLFVPVRYKISGEIDEKVTVHARVTWLLHLISWQADYQNEEFAASLRILGIKKKDKPKVSFEDLEDEEEDGDDDEDEDGVEEADEGEFASRKLRADKDESASRKLRADEDEHEATGGNRSKKSIFSKIKDTILGIKQKITRTWKRLCRAKDKAAAVKELISDEVNRKVAGMVLTELQYLLRHFKFRRIDTDLRFALGDPAATGQTLGVLAMLPFLYHYNFKIYPDFESEESYVKGTFCIQGRIRIVHVLASAVRLIKQKEFRRLMTKLLNR